MWRIRQKSTQADQGEFARKFHFIIMSLM